MLKYEIDCIMFYDDYNRRKKFACIELDSKHLKAIVNRKTERIMFVFKSIYRIFPVFEIPLFELENGHGEHFIIFFDENNNIYTSDIFDKVTDVLANFVICEKEGKRFLIEITFESTKLKLKSGQEFFKNCTNNYVIMYNIRKRLCFLDKDTLQCLGPSEFISIPVLKGKEWMIVIDSYNHPIIVRTTDFEHSIPYNTVSGYFYTENKNTVRSDNLLIASSEKGKHIFDTTKMTAIGQDAYLEIQPINEYYAKVKVASDSLDILNLKTGLLSSAK